MTNLTELWNKGKLPEGDYYIKRRNGYLPYDNIDSHGIWRNTIDEDIIEVLAPVPSYEEWKRFIDANDRLFEAVKSLTIERDMTQEENTQLKELLKRARKHLSEQETPYSLIKRIDEALNEQRT